MKSVELFSGCGGLALGTARAGAEHVTMVEWDADACGTLFHNKKRKVEHAQHWNIVHGDVRLVDWSEIEGKVDLIAGGPPCQPFSIGGKHKGKMDSRDMWPEAIRAVRELRPHTFLFENVRGLARPAFSAYLQWIVSNLSHPDLVRGDEEDHESHLARLEAESAPPEYKPIILKINAADYGAPQKRHRVLIAGVHRDLGITLNFPAATHSRERLLWDQWVTAEYWKRHGLDAAQRSPMKADLAIVKRLRSMSEPPPGLPWITVRDALAGLGEPNGRDNHVFQPGARTYQGHTGSPLDEPAKALKAGDHGVPGGENMAVLDDGSVRYFTIREAARLQGLPDNWHFVSSWTVSMRQIGNAVPTQLAEALGRWIGSEIERGRQQQRIAA